jgi:hypothetical protein
MSTNYAEIRLLNSFLQHMHLILLANGSNSGDVPVVASGIVLDDGCMWNKEPT